MMANYLEFETSHFSKEEYLNKGIIQNTRSYHSKSEEEEEEAAVCLVWLVVCCGSGNVT